MNESNMGVDVLKVKYLSPASSCWVIICWERSLSSLGGSAARTFENDDSTASKGSTDKDKTQKCPWEDFQRWGSMNLTLVIIYQSVFEPL